MAGRPKRQAMIAELERRTREEMGDGATHLDYALQWIASGQTILALANDIGKSLGVQIFRAALSDYLNGISPEAEQALSRARVRGAHGLVEDALNIVETSAADSDVQSKVRNQVQVRQWIAERWNRDELGQPKQGVSVTLNIGTAHIGAMRVREIEPSVIVPAIAAPAEDASFEIIES